MEAFSLQLPTVPPKVGNFGYHSERLEDITHDLNEFMLGKVDEAIGNLKEKVADEKEDSKDTAAGTDNELAPSAPKRAKQGAVKEDEIARNKPSTDTDPEGQIVKE
jgi:uncharacterized protein YjbJ (UPF0337 family)